MPEATSSEMHVDVGLVHTIVGDSEMSFIDGQEGVLEYVGIDIDSLARGSTFEEVVFLLWRRRLPTATELKAFTAEIREAYELPGPIVDMVRATPPSSTPMHILRTLVSALSLHDEGADDPSIDANERKGVRMLAQAPAIVAAFDRHRKGLEILPPDPGQSIAGSFLTMLNGTPPTKTMEHALDVCLILQAEHGLNASTFAAMVTIATLSDMYSAVTTAIGTLKGPLHGGANEAVMEMLQEIGDIDSTESFILAKLDARERVMGFGHRVYKAVDPRATYLRTFTRDLASDTGNESLYEISRRIEDVMEKAVAAKGIYPNVDFYSATTYWSLGLAIDLFTPIFVMSRIAGWTGHCIEQLRDNRLIRPRCNYVGPHGASYVPIADR